MLKFNRLLETPALGQLRRMLDPTPASVATAAATGHVDRNEVAAAHSPRKRPSTAMTPQHTAGALTRPASKQAHKETAFSVVPPLYESDDLDHGIVLADMTATRAAISNAGLSAAERVSLLVDFISAYQENDAIMQEFVLPTQWPDSPMVLAAELMVEQPTTQNVRAFAMVFLPLMQAINRVGAQPSEHRLTAHIEPTLRKTFATLVKADAVLARHRDALEPGTLKDLGIGNALAMLLGAGAMAHNLVHAETYARHYKSFGCIDPVGDAVATARHAIAASALGKLDPAKIEAQYPEIKHAMILLTAESVLTAHANILKLKLGGSQNRGRESLVRFLDELKDRAIEAGQGQANRTSKDNMRVFLNLLNELSQIKDVPGNAIASDAERLRLLQGHDEV
jgi:hypothetical protein